MQLIFSMCNLSLILFLHFALSLLTSVEYIISVFIFLIFGLVLFKKVDFVLV